jgi:nucleotide-binding universal stress UspA family protein
MVEKAEAEFKTVVAGYDGGESAEDALSLATAYAELIGARLLVVFAYRSDLVGHDAAEHLLRAALRDLPYGQPAGIRPVADRPAAVALSHVAEREHAELIVVGAGSPVLVAELRRGAPCRVAIAPRGLADALTEPPGAHFRREVA